MDEKVRVEAVLADQKARGKFGKEPRPANRPDRYRRYRRHPRLYACLATPVPPAMVQLWCIPCVCWRGSGWSHPHPCPSSWTLNLKTCLSKSLRTSPPSDAAQGGGVAHGECGEAGHPRPEGGWALPRLGHWQQVCVGVLARRTALQQAACPVG